MPAIFFRPTPSVSFARTVAGGGWHIRVGGRGWSALSAGEPTVPHEWDAITKEPRGKLFGVGGASSPKKAMPS